MPPDPIVAPVRTDDGLTLRSARWSARHRGLLGGTRGTIAIVTGRSEFIEEYYEIIDKLLTRGFDVAIFDWRGQGGSDREIRHTRRGHVSSFAAYRRDLGAFEKQILQPFASPPLFAMGHSMGAAILLDQAHDGMSPFQRLVLSAPMIDVPLRKKKGVGAMAQLANRLGFGTRLIPRGSEEPLFTRTFTDNILTSDRRQHSRLSTATLQLPALAVGAPTIGWVAEAFTLMGRFQNPLYAVETTTPMLILAAGSDRIVDTAATERFAINLKAGRCITIPGSRHQVLMESGPITAQVWAAIDAFLPGQSTSTH